MHRLFQSVKKRGKNPLFWIFISRNTRSIKKNACRSRFQSKLYTAGSQPTCIHSVLGHALGKKSPTGTSYFKWYVELITKAAFIVRSNTAVACTKCRYCTPHCPMPVIVRKVSIFRHTWQSFQKCFYKSKICSSRRR